MNIFISGGCKNGKSYRAQEIARDMQMDAGTPLYYIATMIPKDEEDDARVLRHIKDREGFGFTTIEQGVDILDILDRPDVDRRGVFLLDSVTALLSNEMFPYEGGREGEEGNIQSFRVEKDAATKVAADLVTFAKKTGNTVFVSDYIYSEARIMDEYTEGYSKGLALCDRELAGICDRVTEITYGMAKEWK